MTSYLPFFIAILMFSTIVSANHLPKEECFDLEKVMKDPKMKDAAICKLMDNLCVFTSLSKVVGGSGAYRNSHQIPCGRFEKLQKSTSVKPHQIMKSSK